MSAPPAPKSQTQSSASSSQDNVWVLAAAAAAGAALLGGAFWYLTSRKPASPHSAPAAAETKHEIEHVKPIKRIVLNADVACDDNEASKTADALAREISKHINNMYMVHLSDSGRLDYRALAASPEFAKYKKSLSALEWLALSELSKEQLMAFCFNLYNALAIHAVVELGAPCDTSSSSSSSVNTNTVSRAQFFGGACYKIGSQTYSLDDLEHGILRCNAVNPSSGTFVFPDALQCAGFAIKEIDPRLHFALVKCTASCPPLRPWAFNNFEKGLTSASNSFCLAHVHVDLANRVVSLPSLFQQYAADFGTNQMELLKKVCSFMAPLGSKAPHETYAELTIMLQSAGDIQIEYQPVNFALNGSN